MRLENLKKTTPSYPKKQARGQQKANSPSESDTVSHPGAGSPELSSLKSYFASVGQIHQRIWIPKWQHLDAEEKILHDMSKFSAWCLRSLGVQLVHCPWGCRQATTFI